MSSAPTSDVDLIQRLLLAVHQHNEITRAGKLLDDGPVGLAPSNAEYPRLQIGMFAQYGHQLFFQWQVTPIMQVSFFFRRDDGHGGVAGEARAKLNNVEAVEKIYIDDDGTLHIADHLSLHLSRVLAEARERLAIIEQDLNRRQGEIEQIVKAEIIREHARQRLENELPQYAAQLIEHTQVLDQLPQPQPTEARHPGLLTQGLLARLVHKLPRRKRTEAPLLALWQRIQPASGGYDTPLGELTLQMHPNAMTDGLSLYLHLSASTVVVLRVDGSLCGPHATFASVIVRSRRTIEASEDGFDHEEKVEVQQTYRIGFDPRGCLSAEGQYQPLRYRGTAMARLHEAPRAIRELVTGLEQYLLDNELQLSLTPKALPSVSVLMLENSPTETQAQSVERLKRQLAKLGEQLPAWEASAPDAAQDHEL